MRHTPARACETAFGGEIELRFPFSQELVDALKSAIPGRSRAWDNADRVWRVQGSHAPTAIDLLLEHFPNAEVPGNRVRPGRLIARTETSPASLPVPVVRPAPSAIVAETPPEFLTTILGCPTCSASLEQYVRVTVVTGERIARTEAPPAEFVAVCGGCRGLLIVSFAPAVAPGAE